MLKILFLGIAGLALSGGCAYPALMKTRMANPERYAETIESVLLAQDHSKVVFIGQKYHYIYDCPGVLAKTLTSPFKHAAEADYFGREGARVLEVQADGAVALTLSLVLKRSAMTAAEAEAALEAGFQASEGGDLRASAELEGKRYKAGDFKLPLAVRLNRPYKVEFVEKGSLAGKAAVFLLTPIAVTADAVMVIGAIPLGVLAIPAMAIGGMAESIQADKARREKEKAFERLGAGEKAEFLNKREEKAGSPYRYRANAGGSLEHFLLGQPLDRTAASPELERRILMRARHLMPPKRLKVGHPNGKGGFYWTEIEKPLSVKDYKGAKLLAVSSLDSATEIWTILPSEKGEAVVCTVSLAGEQGSAALNFSGFTLRQFGVNAGWAPYENHFWKEDVLKGECDYRLLLKGPGYSCLD